MQPSNIKKPLLSFMNLIFPPLCPLCAKHEAQDRGLICAVCLEDFKKITGIICNICGTPFPNAAGSDSIKENKTPAPGHSCGKCLKKPPPYRMARSGFYYEGAVAGAIKRLKYNGDTTLTAALAALLLKVAIENNIHGISVVMPVPLHKNRLRQRGFNQSLLLARHIAGAMGLRLDTSTLIKTRDTHAQAGLKNIERQSNVSGTFTLNNGAAVKQKSVLLVDDVLTTGATVRECARALKRAGADVAVITLARVV